MKKANKLHFDIVEATPDDLESILMLQKECYQTEAALHNEFNIPPLTQTIHSITEDYDQGTLFLKVVADGQLIASVRGKIQRNTAFIGRLIVKPEFQNLGLGKRLMKEIEVRLESSDRYELFTGFKSEKNLRLYLNLGYSEFKRQVVNSNLTLVYLQKSVSNRGIPSRENTPS